MSRPEVRLHDVSVTGDVDRAAALAAIERAVGDASVAGPLTGDGVRAAISSAISSVTTEAGLAGTASGAAHLTAPSWVRAPVHDKTTGQSSHGDSQVT